MKPGRIAAWAIAAVAVPGLAACSGTSSGSSPASSASSSAAGTSSPAQSQAGSQQAGSQGQAAGQGQAAASGRLTSPGAHLAFGGPATVGWVPPSQDTGAGAHHGIRLRVSVVSIQKGTMADFRNVQLNGNERKSTPY